MGNPIAPTVGITLDKERNLLLDLNAMASFEEATGISLMSGIDTKNLGMKDYRALIWVCLIHEDEKLTIKQVGKMIHAGNLSEISTAIAKAFEVATPEDGSDHPLMKNRPHG